MAAESKMDAKSNVKKIMRNFFSDQNSFQTKSFSDQKFFRTKFFLSHIFFRTKKKFPTQIFFRTQILFLTHIFLDPRLKQEIQSRLWPSSATACSAFFCQYSVKAALTSIIFIKTFFSSQSKAHLSYP